MVIKDFGAAKQGTPWVNLKLIIIAILIYRVISR